MCEDHNFTFDHDGTEDNGDMDDHSPQEDLFDNLVPLTDSGVDSGYGVQVQSITYRQVQHVQTVVPVISIRMLEFLELREPLRTNCSGIPDPWYFKGHVHTASLAVCTVLIIFVLMLGCIGNGIVLLSALKWKKLRTNFDVLVLNLAGADFLTCTCLAPIFLFLLYSDPPTPVTFCGSILFMGTVSGMLSQLTLVAISLHRLSRVIGRARSSLTLKHTGIILGMIWIVSLSVSLGGTLHVTLNWNGQLGTCQPIINSPNRFQQNFVLFFLAPVTIVSFAVITVSYAVICWTVQKQGRFVPESVSSQRFTGDSHDSQTSEFLRDSPQKGCSPAPRHCCTCSSQTFVNKDNKALTMCLVVIFTTGLCWGPLIISQFIEVITGESIILYQVKLCGIALVFLNSALDPYIYAQHIGQMKHRYSRCFNSLVTCKSVSQRVVSRLPRGGQLGDISPNKRTKSSRGVGGGFSTENTKTAVLVPSGNIKKLLEKCVSNSTATIAQNSVYRNNLLLHTSSCQHHNLAPRLADCGTYFVGKGSSGVVNGSCSQTISKESQSLMEDQ
ncbi:probable G-protein coupled receptor 75 [Ylistrum balloti]|uniref:probable G-protein coupled receptor 75 n=1 Tax=Ylistrum balloti TaxID=509963 RepID=UPI0029058769|nr:probable G-protein coupled receptor 75 [Ylistrum balloti]